MKIVAYLYGYTVREEVVFTHTVLNKITGVILFVFPLTLQFVDMKYSVFFV